MNKIYIYDKILYDAECNIAKVLNEMNNQTSLLQINIAGLLARMLTVIEISLEWVYTHFCQTGAQKNQTSTQEYFF